MNSDKPTTIEEYLVPFPKTTQDVLQKIRVILREEVPDGEECISYAIPAMKRDGKRFLYYAGYPKHVSLYPLPRGDAALEKEIAPYVAGKGTLQFQLDKPIPYDLIRKVVIAHRDNGSPNYQYK